VQAVVAWEPEAAELADTGVALRYRLPACRKRGYDRAKTFHTSKRPRPCSGECGARSLTADLVLEDIRRKIDTAAQAIAVHNSWNAVPYRAGCRFSTHDTAHA
jgi:hypothetical protein